MGEERKDTAFRRNKFAKTRPLGRPWHRWEDNIKMDLKYVGWVGVDCIHLS
jgi:hypothetical protein